MNQSDVLDTRMYDLAPEVCVSALSKQFASRGLAASATREAADMMEAEEKTRALDPCAYRLSLLSDAAIAGMYRCGKSNMETADLLRYAEESLRIKQREAERVETECVYDAVLPEASIQKPEKCTWLMRLRKETSKFKNFLATTVKTAIARLPLWFDIKREKASSETKKLPVSAFAAIIAIAVSLVMIVASALMITHTETKISKLNSEISTLQTEIRDLEGKLEAGADLMEIRRIAVEEYGMVEEDYLRMEQLTLNSTENVEIYEQKRDGELGLSAILSAIGWKK